MKGTRSGLESDFPRKDGTCKEIKQNHGQVTVTSYISRTGDHSAMIMEYCLRGTPVTRKVHLQYDETGIVINEEPPQINDDASRDATQYHYTCYDMSDSQRTQLEDAIRKFKTKNASGRYTYRLAGGVIGRLTTRPGKRGVNCADFIKKVLGDAKIVMFSESAISMPKTVAKRGGSVFVDLP